MCSPTIKKNNNWTGLKKGPSLSLASEEVLFCRKMATTHHESRYCVQWKECPALKLSEQKGTVFVDNFKKLADNLLTLKIWLPLLVNEFRHEARAYLTGKPVNGTKWIQPGGCCRLRIRDSALKNTVSWWTSHLCPAEGTSVIPFPAVETGRKAGIFLREERTAGKWQNAAMGLGQPISNGSCF